MARSQMSRALEDWISKCSSHSSDASDVIVIWVWSLDWSVVTSWEVGLVPQSSQTACFD